MAERLPLGRFGPIFSYTMTLVGDDDTICQESEKFVAFCHEN